MSPRRLLVIDDSPTIRKLVELSFAATPWIVEFASSGRDGIDKASARPPHVILLDFVLPDMRGTAVCGALAESPDTADVPIIVMSAKHDNVRELFKPFPAVGDFIGKPFSATDVVGRVDGILQRTARRSEEKNPQNDGADASDLSFDQKQAAAQALYGKLRQKFALIPQLMSQLDTAAPAAFFARKLLTPQLVDELFDALRPFFEQSSPNPEPRPRGVRDQGADVLGGAFAGTLGGLSALDLLRLFASGKRTGTLRLAYSDREIVVTVVDGNVVLVTSDDPELCLRGDGGFGAPAAELIGKAELLQQSTGTPLVAALARACGVSEAERPAVVGRVGRFLLLHAVASPPLRFSWLDQDRSARHPDELTAPISLADLELAVLRDPAASAPPDASYSSARFCRGENFSRKIRDFALIDGERQILAIVDDQRGLAELAEQAELPLEEVTQIASRLVRVGLLRKQDAEKRKADGPLLVADPDGATFVEPLRKLMEASVPPVRVVSVPMNEPLHPAIRNESPRLVLVNASAAGAHAVRTAEAVRSDPRLVQPRLVAVLDAPAPDEAGRLATAGFDAVLTKPIRCADLERLLRSQVD